MVGANRPFAAVADEVEHIIHEGDLVPASHPVAKAHPELTHQCRSNERRRQTTKRQR
jgi:hypothetical protein